MASQTKSFLSDSIFLPGNHFGNLDLPCQDYALDVEKSNGQGFVVLSDGCSSASDTDLGARILCHLAAKRIKQSLYIDSTLITEALQALNQFYFEQDDCDPLLCTLLTAEEKEDLIQINCFGDGIFGAEYQDCYQVTKIEYANNAPYYLAYEAFPDLKSYYQEFYSDAKKIVTELKFRVKDLRQFLASESHFYDHLEVLDFQSTDQDFNLFTSQDFCKDNLRKVFLFSDGLDSLQKNQSNQTIDIPWEKTLIQIFSQFKKHSVGALRRSLVKLNSEWKKNNSSLGDDLAAGVLMLRP